tara:strand:+ start:512 stop:919 length:408 start_codon:yes stop_codon:yes gene_type:complete
MTKITLDQAKLEVIGFLQDHDLETDTTLMLEEDAQEFNDILEAVAKPVSQGRAIIDGNKYVLTLREPIGDTKEVAVSGMSAADMFAADKAKKGNEMAKTGHMIASMVKLTFAEVNRMKSQDFMLLSRLSGLFMAV